LKIEGTKRLNVLVTGGGGMLSTTLVPHLQSRGHQVTSTTIDDLDITNYESVLKILSDLNPDLVLHCAAYTAVDQAETDEALAFAVNAYGTENLAVACSTVKGTGEIPLLYISTDYVFDGKGKKPYTTWDKTEPLSVYGRSKLAGELAVQRHLRHFYIVRTSWLYGPGGKNFVDTIYNIAKQGKPLKVVADQHGSPTSTATLSIMIGDLIESGRYGVYHATDNGATTWYDFAREIVRDLGVEVEAITTEDMPRPAPRPGYSVLDKTTLINTIKREPISWEDALKAYMSQHLAPVSLKASV
jgi:dTDP-4-dehydrorhamnose reductase